MIRRTAVVILQFPQQRNTCSEPAMKTLEITEETQMKTYSKNNHQMCSIKKCSYLAKFIGKRLCQSLYFNKVASWRSATLLKRDTAKI